MTPTPRTRRCAAALLVLALVVAACTEADDGASGTDGVPDLGDPGDCVVADLSVSPEKLDLLTRLAQDFNDSDAEVDGECAFARVQSKSSGAAAQLLATGWDEEREGPRPPTRTGTGSRAGRRDTSCSGT